MSEFWSACLSQFERDLPAQQFNAWIKSLRLEDENGTPHTLRLVAPNRFVLKWVRERYLPRIEAISRNFYDEPVTINLDVEEAGADPAASPADADLPHATAPRVVDDDGPARFVDSVYEKTRLNPMFTFDTLVSGRANDLARAAAQQVAMNPGTSYNPLFVYGGVGLGKTHLIHAIGNAVFDSNPKAVVRYIHAEDYVSDVVRAYQQKAFDVFKRNYRSLDLLLIDDIQFFNKKDRTQEEFFYAFNALIEAHKQVIITCDTYPKEIAGMEDRLISRFGWGLTVAIEPPELEMRVAILIKKAEAEGVRLPEDLAFFIAKHIQSNVRELEGALKRVLAYSNFAGQQLTLEVAREALKDVLAIQFRQVSIENIQKTVADYYKLKVSEMYSKKRSRNVARPRQIAMALAKELTQLSLPDIGDAFGGRDHTTVLHACRKVAALKTESPEINRDFEALLQVLRS